jgi:hypothetical protein
MDLEGTVVIPALALRAVMRCKDCRFVSDNIRTKSPLNTSQLARCCDEMLCAGEACEEARAGNVHVH